MSLNWRQFELGILKPTLLLTSTDVAVKLVGETLWHESDRLRALGQYPLAGAKTGIPFGPGLGIASIERSTWDWMKDKDRIRMIETLRMRDYEELAWDLRLNVITCRLRYRLDPLPLPRIEDGIEARATYWWKVYNRGQVDRRPDYIANAKAIPWVQP